MRGYCAVIKDSFREALASRLLWIVMILIAVVLLGLAPFSLTTQMATQLRNRELVDAERFLRDLTSAKDADNPSPGKHIWSQLSQEDRDRIETLLNPDAEQDEDRRRGGPRARIVSDLNDLIESPDFYDEESWADIELDEETTTLLKLDGPSDDQVAARNLRLLARAFPRSIDITEDTSMSLAYGTAEMFDFDLPPSQVEMIVDETLIVVVSLFLGFFGVFGSLLVTASLIPRTFEPGEIALLLSKPVRRSLLFLTKFFGGCAFTTLCATALVGGVWLLLWLRLGIWKPELLLCIPVYVFLFAIYYAVSATAGLIWRNAIVSLALVVVFWLMLTVVGVTKVQLDMAYIQPRAINEIIPAGDRLFAVNGSRTTLLWNNADWEQKFERDADGIPGFMRRMLFASTRLRPVYDAANDRLLALEHQPARFGGLGSAKLVSGIAENNWEREPEGQPPSAAAAVFVDSDGRVILPARSAVYHFVGQSAQEKKTQEFFNRVLGGFVNATSKAAFNEIQADDIPEWEPGFQAAHDRQTDAIIIHSGRSLHRLDRDDEGRYVSGAKRELDTGDSAVLAVGGRNVLMAFSSGAIEVFDKETLETVATDELPKGIQPRVAEVSVDGSGLAVLTHDDTLWLFDGAQRKPLDWRPPEQGNVTAVYFDDQNRLMVAERQAIRTYESGASRPAEQISTGSDWVLTLYDLAINPLYTILPKPSDLDNFVRYLITGKRSIAIGGDGPPSAFDSDNLQQDRLTFDLWTPLWSNLGFLTVVLGFGCFYVARRDF